MFLYESLEKKKKNETVDIYTTLLTQGIMREKVINPISQMRDTTANVTQDHLQFER